MSFKDQIDKAKLPKHIAFIMDGNGRWAERQGKFRQEGHESGVIALREMVDAALELGISYVTFYAFSTENWNRPKAEVDALMELLVATINAESDALIKKEIRLNAIGELETLPPNCYQNLMEVMEKTSINTKCTLTLALSYSSRNEIVHAAKKIAEQIQNKQLNIEDINEETFQNSLHTFKMPDPELMIRTSGECRISNFLLWQMAYTELYFSPKFWPEFRKHDLYEAILTFQQRERRFGLTSAQLQNHI